MILESGKDRNYWIILVHTFDQPAQASLLTLCRNA